MIVVAMIVAQYKEGCNRRTAIWAITATTNTAAKIPVAAGYPRCIDIETVSPPVSPSVFAAILMIQNVSVTSGTFLRRQYAAVVM